MVQKGNKRTYMLKFRYLIEVPENEGIGADARRMQYAQQIAKQIRTDIDTNLESVLGRIPNHLGWQSSNITVIDGEYLNSGRCAVCGMWVTDVDKPGLLDDLKRGATVGQRLLCWEHLPRDHWFFANEYT
jgi:hypothetical protein